MIWILANKAFVLALPYIKAKCCSPCHLGKRLFSLLMYSATKNKEYLSDSQLNEIEETLESDVAQGFLM